MAEEKTGNFLTVFWKLQPVLISAIIAIACIFIPSFIMLSEKYGIAGIHFNIPMYADYDYGVFDGIIFFGFGGEETSLILAGTLITTIMLSVGGGLLLTIAIIKLMQKGDEKLLKIMQLVSGSIVAAAPIGILGFFNLLEPGLFFSPEILWSFGLFGPFIAGGLAIVCVFIPK